MTTEDIKRPNYAEGQYLGSSDFVAEQQYHRDALRRMNLAQHTWGIFAGLELVEQPQEGSDTIADVYVQPGLAVDGFGRPIVVFYPYKLDTALFQQPQFSQDQWVQVWIRYASEETDPPRYGYEVCSAPALSYRTHEIFCIAVGPISPPHDQIVLAGAAALDDKLVPDLSVPAQGLPQDDERFQWWIPLGWAHWDGTSGFVKSTTSAQGQQRHQGRLYGGVVADKILAQAGLLRIADRSTKPPLPSGQSGVGVTVEGSVVIDRTVSVGTIKADVPVTVRSTVPNEDLLEFEDSTGAGNWKLEQKAGTAIGLNVVDTSDAMKPASRLFVKQGGNVGIGTTNPERWPLAIRGTGQWEELVSLKDAAGFTKWHVNQLVDGQNPGLNFAETKVADGRLFLAAGGNVGIGTVEPATKLDVAGDIRWGGNARLNADQGGSIELGGNGTVPGVGSPYIDFHFTGKTEDFNTRIINDGDGRLSIKAKRGLHIQDLEAEGVIWSAIGYTLGPSRQKIPVDVVTGSWPVSAVGAAGTITRPVPSRLPSVSDAYLGVALANVGTGFSFGPWAVWWDDTAKVQTGANEWTFTVNWSRGDTTDVFAAIAFVAVFVP